MFDHRDSAGRGVATGEAGAAPRPGEPAARIAHLVVPPLDGDEEELDRALVAALRSRFGRVAVWPVADREEEQVACIAALPAEEPLLVVPARGAGDALKAVLAGRVAVLAGRFLPAARMDAFVVENYRAGYLAGKHLVNLKHQSIAYLGPGAGATSADERLRGFRQALAHNGRTLPPERVRQLEPAPEPVRAACAALWETAEPPTALFVTSPRLAAYALEALEQQGLRVPGDVALVGYGDGPVARALRPRLTAVVPPLEELARRAAARLAELAAAGIRARDRREEPERLAPRLVIRASCGLHALRAG